ncbi:MAG: hypothetical protein GDA56_11985 [Hormoscilla sp. GM7CHS1pb]|nr:hypothetical protein [Hormoscilla sp. GM7CHS1pb]
MGGRSVWDVDAESECFFTGQTWRSVSTDFIIMGMLMVATTTAPPPPPPEP